MRFFLLTVFLLSTFPAAAQSGRVGPTASASPILAAELTVKQMFDEANSYNKVKFAEYEQKKVTYSERLRLETERQRRQLAAKYATSAGARPDLSGDDL